LNETKFLEQIRANQGIIFKLVSLYANDAEEKKDLYQEIVLQAWRGWPAFRAESKFSTWLYRVCLNTIFTQKRKKQPLDFRDSLNDLEPGVQHAGLHQENVDRLRRAIRRFGETDRALISLHLDGYDNTETGEILGISANHVAVKLHRIKQQLANLLKEA
jgi:RNA polymerase sigma factor (sigma-70 family)